MGKVEHGSATPEETELLRGLTPLSKLTTGRWAVAGAAEVMEAIGGVGYCEDSGIPILVRNTHVLPIWEGTTNVLSLDFLRAAARSGALEAVLNDIRATVGPLQDDAAVGRVASFLFTTTDALEEMVREVTADVDVAQANARSIALSLATTYAASRLCAQGAWAAARGDGRTAATAERMIERGLLVSRGPNHLELGMDEEISGADLS
jgi:hypothetical protein